MKIRSIKKAYIAILGAAVLAGVSCKKSFIDLTDPTAIVTSDYYKDSASMSTAVIAAYAGLQDIYGKRSGSRGLWAFSELISDNTTSLSDGNGLSDLDVFSFKAPNAMTNIQSQWTYTYRCIARCNVVLARIEPIVMSATVKSRWIAEMKFIRALVYFNAVRLWGPIPLVTKEIETVQDAYVYGRSPVADVYAQIEKDLMEAEAEVNLPVKYTVNSDMGRVTKPAVKGMLGKVYLTQKKYTDAVTKLGEFVTSYDATTHSLLGNYADIFLTTNELNAEIIFAVRYSKGNDPVTGSPFTNLFAAGTSSTGSSGVGSVNFYNTLTKDLVDTLVANGTADKRIAASYVLTGTFYQTRKYIDVPASDQDADNDWIVLRYADVLLMYAEALNEAAATNTVQAVGLVNRVRTRAGLTASLLPTTISQTNLRLAIERERRLELNLEGHRWFDLVRTDRAVTVMNAHFTKYFGGTVQIQNFQTLLPIPISEITTNPILTQNPGYN